MKIAVIGAGNMANAIIRSVVRSNRMPADTFCVYDKSKEKIDNIVLLGVNVAFSLKEACETADFILFATKPQDLCDVVSELKSECTSFASKKYISICAGISTEYICNLVGVRVPVIRVMPNTPMLVGAGATAISRNSLVTDKDYSKICGIFSFGGEVASIPEEQMNSIISINSSSPAYFYEFIRIMIEYAKTQGIDEKVARSMAQNAMLGAAKMLLMNDKTPFELIEMVRSKKGTTDAALNSLSDNKFRDIVFEALDACTKRAVELGK